MKNLLIATVMFTFTAVGQCEEYETQYSWDGKGDRTFTQTLVVTGKKAVERDDLSSVEYEVLEDTEDELIVFKRFTKKNSGKDYPSGVAMIVIDKKSGVLSRSNTFAAVGRNNHGTGVAKLVKK